MNYQILAIVVASLGILYLAHNRFIASREEYKTRRNHIKDTIDNVEKAYKYIKAHLDGYKIEQYRNLSVGVRTWLDIKEIEAFKNMTNNPPFHIADSNRLYLNEMIKKLDGIFNQVNSKNGIETIHGTIFLLLNFSAFLKKALTRGADFKYKKTNMENLQECILCYRTYYDNKNRDIVCPNCIKNITDEIIAKKTMKDSIEKLKYLSRNKLMNLMQDFKNMESLENHMNFANTFEYLAMHK